MLAKRLGWAAAAAMLACGCAWVPYALRDATLSRLNDSVYDLNPRFDLPPVASAPVAVELENRSAFDVDARVTMRVAGQRVHFSTRRVAGGSAAVLIGPDRADSVLVEGTWRKDPPTSLPPRTFFLGIGFQAGDVIPVLLADAEPQPPGQPGKPPPQAPTLSVRISGLDHDLRIAAGTPVSFAVLTTGAGPEALLDVLADPDADPDSGNELTVAGGLVVRAENPVVWDTTGVAPALYRLYAQVRDADRFARSQPAPGRVRINAEPTLVFDSPPDDLLVTRGRAFIIGWAGQDDDDDAAITIFLDQDGVFDGDERTLRAGIREDDLEDRELAVRTDELELGTYFVGGTISDGLATSVTYAGRVCLTDRLVGRLSPGEPDFGPGQITSVRGDAHNLALGTHIDIRRDLDGDGRCDMLLSDPRALASGLRQSEVGEVYYHAGGPWPRYLDTSELTLRIVGQDAASGLGQRVALLPPTNDDPQGDILIGAPFWDHPAGQPDAGRAYVLDGIQVRDLGTLDLSQLDGELGGSLLGPTDQPGLFGYDVESLGDVDGDGVADYAVAASAFDWFGRSPLPPPGAPGVVALLAGGQLPASVDFSGIGCTLPGAFAIGVAPDGAAGHAVRGLGDLDADEAADFAIGAPGAALDGGPAAGVVYLVHGPLSLADDCQGSGNFFLDEVGTPTGPRGQVFAGQNAGDRAGAALAAGDFDGDGRTDLAIAAPGYDNGRGRVYLIYDVNALPSDGAPSYLADVGLTIPGVVFDGVAPADQTGWSLAPAGDFDLDGADDLLIGAPGTESRRGAVFLVYGGQALQAAESLTRISTCDLAGLQLVGPRAGARLGFAVSAGELDGDRVSDIAVGAPGDGTVAGEAFILFGRWPYARLGPPQHAPGDGRHAPLAAQPVR